MREIIVTIQSGDKEERLTLSDPGYAGWFMEDIADKIWEHLRGPESPS